MHFQRNQRFEFNYIKSACTEWWYRQLERSMQDNLHMQLHYSNGHISSEPGYNFRMNVCVTNTWN
jgi:hypothetical protein